MVASMFQQGFCCKSAIVHVVVLFSYLLLLAQKSTIISAFLVGKQPTSATVLHKNRKNTGTTARSGSDTSLYLFDSILEQINNAKSILPSSSPFGSGAASATQARDMIQVLVQDEKCFSTESGAFKFINECAENVIYEDRFEAKPFVGKTEVADHVMAKVAARKGRGDVRIDRITDGNTACGYAWTWTSGNEEGLRGTTLVELDKDGKIVYVCEIPEPLYKPGDLTIELLRALTKGAEYQPKTYTKRTPTIANDLARYLYVDVQGDVEEAMRFFDEKIVYRDFNFVDTLTDMDSIRQFIDDFTFPGIEFRPIKFDDGIDSTCFTWEVCLEGQTEAIRGISIVELDPKTRKMTYVRDIPESAIKPAPLGNLARTLRPGLGVFKGVPIGSRPGGM